MFLNYHTNFLNFNIMKHLKQESTRLKLIKKNRKFQHMLMHTHMKFLNCNIKKHLEQKSNILKL